MNQDHQQELSLAKVHLSIPVAWGEMDALGHVNNVAYFRYLESSRVEYLRRLGFGRLPGGATPGIGFILQAAQCRFRRSVVYPDTLRVTARCTNIGTDRFTLAHEIISTSLNETAAVGEGTIVCYDYAKASKVPVPPELRAAIQSLETGPISDPS